jgi:hypothetical protein
MPWGVAEGVTGGVPGGLTGLQKAWQGDEGGSGRGGLGVLDRAIRASRNGGTLLTSRLFLRRLFLFMESG